MAPCIVEKSRMQRYHSNSDHRHAIPKHSFLVCGLTPMKDLKLKRVGNNRPPAGDFTTSTGGIVLWRSAFKLINTDKVNDLQVQA